MADLQTKRIGDAYAKLGIREPFIAAVMSKIKREVSADVPTAATNGSWVKYNPDFCAKQTDAALFGLVVHESLHIVLMHMWRREGRDPSLWNYANDAIINKYIKDRRYELPKGGVFVDWVTEAMSSEEVYNRLKEELPPPPPGGHGKGEGEGDGDGDDSDGGNGGGSGSGNGGDSGGYPAGGFDGQGDIFDAVDEATKADLEATIVAAAQMAKKCGQGSALIDRILEDIGTPQVPWTEVVRNMMSESSRDDYTFQRPRRRYVSQGIYLPSLHSDALGGLLIGTDTSGSMWGNPKELEQVAGELNAIVSDTRPEFVEVAYCDYAITKLDRFDRDEDVEFAPRGGGGTSFQPVFEHLENSDDDYVGVIYFTDMCADFSNLVDPGIPVIWVATDARYVPNNVPFGTVVTLNL